MFSLIFKTSMGSKMRAFGFALNFNQCAILLKASFTYVLVPETSIYIHQTVFGTRCMNTILCLKYLDIRLVLNSVQHILTNLKSIPINDKTGEHLLLRHLE